MVPRANKSTPTVSDAELEVLKVLWSHGPGTVREVLERLGSDQAYTTVQTLLGRLCEKGHVRTDRRDLAHVFTAVTQRTDLAERQVEQVADSLLDGAVGPLVLRLVEKGRFSAEEIDSFRDLLRAAEQRLRARRAPDRGERS